MTSPEIDYDKQIAELTEKRALAIKKEAAIQQLSFTPQTVAFPFVLKDKEGKIIRITNCLANTKKLLDAYNISVKYNRMTKQQEIFIPNLVFNADVENNFKFNHIIDLCAHHFYADSKLAEHLFNIAEPYHPVCDWIESVEWDGSDRLPDFLDSIILNDANDDNLKKLYFTRWFMSCMAALYEEMGCAAQGVLTYTGEQGIGKTTHMLTILPDPDWLCEGTVLDPTDKDSIIEVTGHFLCELGEIDATFRKQDIARLKAFITKKKDTLRKPYERKSESHARRTIFYASVNDKTFLVDKSGNRRFWVLDVKAFNFDHNINIQQFWAQLKHMYDGGEKWVMSKEELQLLNTKNDDFTQLDPVDEVLSTMFEIPKNDNGEHMTATEICKKMGMQTNKPNVNNIANVLRKKGYTNKKVGGCRGFIVKQIKFDY